MTSLRSSFDYTALTDISRPHDFWPAKARREPPFAGSTVFYRSLADRSIDELQGKSREEILEFENDRFAANYSLDGYYGYTVVFDVASDQEEIQAQHIIGPFKGWKGLFTSPDNKEVSSFFPPVAPPCLLLRRKGKPGESYLSIDAALYLRSMGIQLVGVESSSIASEDDLEAIESLLIESDISWLVRIDLSKAKSNVPYLLFALPIERGATGPLPCRPVLVATKQPLAPADREMNEAEPVSVAEPASVADTN